MRILVDMDGTIANWGAKWDSLAADKLHLGLSLTKDQKQFNLFEGLDEDGQQAVRDIMNWPDFYKTLEPFDGAVEALHDMVAEGHDVRLVTSPWLSHQTCASDKLFWAEQYIGEGWARRTVITSDKTLVRGHILFDDKPEIEGDEIPSWEHVYFTQPYNRHLTHNRRINNWSEWRSITWEHLVSLESVAS